MKRISRLEKASRKRYGRSVAITFAALIFIFAIFYFFGASLLVNTSLFLEKINSDVDDNFETENKSFIPAPIMDNQRSSTNSAKIKIEGTAPKAKKVKLFINGKFIKESLVEDKNKFIFSNISLEEGRNDIKAQSIGYLDSESAYSTTLKIVFNKQPPDLTIEYPEDNQSISGKDRITVKGKTDKEARVTVNGFWAIVDNSGSFKYLLKVEKGENTIDLTATDEAGNRSEKQIKIKVE